MLKNTIFLVKNVSLSNSIMKIIVLQCMSTTYSQGIVWFLWKKKHKISFKKFFDFLIGDQVEEVY